MPKEFNTMILSKHSHSILILCQKQEEGWGRAGGTCVASGEKGGAGTTRVTDGNREGAAHRIFASTQMRVCFPFKGNSEDACGDQHRAPQDGTDCSWAAVSVRPRT